MQTIEQKNGVAVIPENLPSGNPVNDTLALIERMAINPAVDADKMGKLVDLQLKVMDRQAEIDFNEAMMKLQPQLPVIKKNGKIDYGKGKPIPYARIEDIEREIRPLYLAEGFTFSFDQDGDNYIGILTHKSGHKKISHLKAPPDNSGGKNVIQAIVSSGTYAQRIMMKRLLNLVFEGDDDDGAGGPITHEQAQEIMDGLLETGLDEKKFLKNLKVESVYEIKTKDHGRAITAIDAKRWQLSQAKKGGANA